MASKENNRRRLLSMTTTADTMVRKRNQLLDCPTVGPVQMKPFASFEQQDLMLTTITIQHPKTYQSTMKKY